MVRELHVSEAGGPERVVALGHGLTRIGRDSIANEIVVQDAMVSSGSHCGFVRDAEGVRLIDFGHPNGQLVNGVRQTADQRLEVGDVVLIGRHVVIRCVGGP